MLERQSRSVSGWWIVKCLHQGGNQREGGTQGWWGGSSEEKWLFLPKHKDCAGAWTRANDSFRFATSLQMLPTACSNNYPIFQQLKFCIHFYLLWSSLVSLETVHFSSRTYFSVFYLTLRILFPCLDYFLSSLRFGLGADKPIKENGIPHNCSFWTGTSL